MTAEPGLDKRALRAIGIDGPVIADRGRLDGQRAVAFLARLPALVERWQSRLGLTGARLLPGGVLSAAFLCRMREKQVVLKLSAPYASGARAEAAALATWGGRGACRLLFATDDGRVMLLEAIRPGDPPPPAGEVEDARRAAELLACLHGAPAIPPAVPDAAEELGWRFQRAHQLLDGPSPARGAVSHDQIEIAYHRALGLHAERPVTVLLHGDFLDKNIVLDEAGAWWAIDPRPCRGDPCLDAAFWALAHRGGADVRRRARLIAQAAGLEASRVSDWMQVFAVCEAVLARDACLSRAYRRAL